VQEGVRFRLLIGPFRGARDVELFSEDLDAIGVDAFSWTNAEGQAVSKL
jgi:hypothetical protein